MSHETPRQLFANEDAKPRKIVLLPLVTEFEALPDTEARPSLCVYVTMGAHTERFCVTEPKGNEETVPQGDHDVLVCYPFWIALKNKHMANSCKLTLHTGHMQAPLNQFVCKDFATKSPKSDKIQILIEFPYLSNEHEVQAGSSLWASL